MIWDIISCCLYAVLGFTCFVNLTKFRASIGYFGYFLCAFTLFGLCTEYHWWCFMPVIIGTIVLFVTMAQIPIITEISPYLIIALFVYRCIIDPLLHAEIISQ